MRELSLHILDVAQNAIAADAAQITLSITEDAVQHTLQVILEDDGCGMTQEQLQQVTDPFFTTRTTRKVGMGIPLFRMAAQQTGGTLIITSRAEGGTRVEALFHTDHVDCTPLGDMAATLVSLISMNTARDFVYRHIIGANTFRLDTKELKDMLEGVPLNEPSVVLWLQEYITEQIGALSQQNTAEQQI